VQLARPAVNHVRLARRREPCEIVVQRRRRISEGVAVRVADLAHDRARHDHSELIELHSGTIPIRVGHEQGREDAIIVVGGHGVADRIGRLEHGEEVRVVGDGRRVAEGIKEGVGEVEARGPGEKRAARGHSPGVVVREEADIAPSVRIASVARPPSALVSNVGVNALVKLCHGSASDSTSPNGSRPVRSSLA
jgi:hypothetical protein